MKWVSLRGDEVMKFSDEYSSLLLLLSQINGPSSTDTGLGWSRGSPKIPGAPRLDIEEIS